MKTFKLLMPFLLSAFMFAGCDTDDLKSDIDELKNRVESLEAQVSAMNDNINTLKVFIDGNKSIKSFEETENGYKIVLSDNQELTLTQGVKGTVSTPDITISADGDWVINGVEQDGMKAVGENAPAPKFTIKEAEFEGETASYWYVDLQDGNGEQPVLDENGKPVKATTDGPVEVNDEFFKNVEVKGNEMVVTLHDDKTYSLPIIEKLTCEIVTEGVEGFKDGVLTVGYGKTVTLDVNISEADYIVTAPMGWTAVMTEPSEGKAGLTLTAPAAATASSRAAADNTKDLVLQVNKGVNWIIDKIQVVAVEVIDDYYTEYNSGKAITLLQGTEFEQEVKKDTYGDALLIDESNSTDGVYTMDKTPTNKVIFVKPGIKVNYTATGSLNQAIFISNSSIKQASISFPVQIKVNQANGIVAFHNMNMEFTVEDNILAQNYNGAFENVIFDKCNIYDAAGANKSFAYISTTERYIKNLVFNSCKYKFDEKVTSRYLISISNSTAEYGHVYLNNNVFYSMSDKMADFKVFTGTKGNLGKFTLLHNTFVEVNPNWSTMIYANELKGLEMSGNLFFTEKDQSANLVILRPTTYPTSGICAGNAGYIVSAAGKTWLAAFGKGIFEGAEEIVNIPSNPFDGGKFDLATGTFVPNAEYAKYGAKFE